MTTNHLLRIGILGAAQIARKNVAAIFHESSSCCRVTAIASRSEEKAQRFVKEHCKKEGDEIKVFSGELAYQELLSSSLVDAVYIPLPTSLHREWVEKALRNGKHVLVEKPVTTNMEDFQDLHDLAQQEQKYLLDGTMFVHHPRTHQLLEYLRSSSSSDEDASSLFGTVLRIDSTFTFLGNDEFFENNIRILENGDPLGCLGDLGWYSIRMALLVMKTQKKQYATVKKVKATTYQLNKGGVPIDVTGLVYFSEDSNENSTVVPPKLLSLHCSFVHPLRQRVEIIGSKQSAILNDFVIPKQQDEESAATTFELRSQTLTDRDLFAVDQVQTVNTTNNAEVEGSSQETLMWRHFCQTCHAMMGKSSSSEESTIRLAAAKEMIQQSYETQKVVLALLESIRKGGTEINVE